MYGRKTIEYQPVANELFARVVANGFGVRTEKKGDPHIRVERWLARSGDVADVATLWVIAGMPLIDLEHELDHIEQITTRFHAQGEMVFTDVYEQTSRGWRKRADHPHVLRPWQNAITEYHVRLLEFQRLYERGENADVLQFHAAQLAIWSQQYWGKGRGLGQSAQKRQWEERFFPDLPALRESVGKLLAESKLRVRQEVKKNPYSQHRPL